MEKLRALAQRGENLPHLFPGGIERAGVVDHEIGSFDFFFVGNLRRHAASHLGTGNVFGDSEPLRETQNALFGMAGDDDQIVEAGGGVCFKDEGSFDNCNGSRIALGDFFHPLVFIIDYRGVDNCIEFLESGWRSAGVAECSRGQLWTADTSVKIQDFTAEAADYFIINGKTGLHQRVTDGIGLNEMRAKLDKLLANHGFAARDAASEAEF